MRLFVYPMTSDTNFAPHIDGKEKYLTLATCKPSIRRRANKGDWIMGVSGKTMKMSEPGKVIYLMEVTEPPLDFDSYWNDSGFRNRLDNIYFKQGRIWRQLKNPYHTPKDRRNDLGGKYVLISRNFYFFGGNGPNLGKLGFPEFAPDWRDFKSDFDKRRTSSFIEQVKSQNTPGVLGKHIHPPRESPMTSPGVC